MELFDFIAAIGGKLKGLYPDCKVYDERIRQKGYENCFHINIISTKQAQALQKRRKRAYDFDIAYFGSEGGNDALYEMTRVLLENFDTIEVCGSLYHARDIESIIVDEALHLQFSVSFFITEKSDDDENFKGLELNVHPADSTTEGGYYG